MNLENKATFDILAGDKDIRVKTFGNISSVNFSKKAFYNKSWNSRTMMARGLFFNNNTYDIVCRGYEKFFNIDEVPATSMRKLKKLQYPLTAYTKENGYLGLLGVNPESAELVFASKSTTESDFALNLRRILYAQFSEETMEQLKKEMLDNNVCLVFEVIDPVFDPHIIEYPDEKVVLLDVIYRQVNFKKLPYEQLITFAEKYGFECKQRAFTVDSFEELQKVVSAATQYDYTHNDERIEGFVFEDGNGFQFKLKCGYYTFWKTARRITQNGGNLNRALAFLNDEQKAMLQDVVALYDGETLFELRKKYEQTKKE